MAKAGPAEQAVREIRRRTRRKCSAEEKIRIVLEGLRGEESIAAPSRSISFGRETLGECLYGVVQRAPAGMSVNFVYRASTRIGVDAVPDAETILKIAKGLGPDVIMDLHQRIVDVAKRGVTHGRRFRIKANRTSSYPLHVTAIEN